MVSKSELELKLFGTNDREKIMDLYDERSDACFDARAPKNLKEWVDMEIPYYAPEDQLPCPLPTMTDIEAAWDTENNLTTGARFSSCWVYRLADVYAVKFGLEPIILQEAENLLYLAKHTKMKVPKVYAAFEHQGADPRGFLHQPKYSNYPRSDLPKYYYLIMDFLPGTVCELNFWHSLSQTTQDNIVSKVAEQMRLLRDAPTPSPAYYGRIHHQGWFPGISKWRYAGIPGAMKGPYDSHEAFLDATYTSQAVEDAAQVQKDFDPMTSTLFCSFWDVMRRATGTTPVLCHLDFDPRQVMIQETDDKENPDVVIFDWAWMGWVPAYLDTALSWDYWPDMYHDGMYSWAMVKDVRPSHLDTALYFRQWNSKGALKGTVTVVEEFEL